MWVGLKRFGLEYLEPENVSTVLGRYNDEAVDEVLNLWSDFDAQLDPDLASGDINQILGEQVVTAAAEAKAAVDKFYAQPWDDTAKKRANSAKFILSNLDRSTRRDNEIQNTDEFIDMLPEVAATAEHVLDLRDPEVRAAMYPADVMAATDSARRLTNDVAAAKAMFDHLRSSGVDPAPLEKVLHDELDKHGMADLLSMDAYPPMEMRSRADQKLLKFRHAQDAGGPAEQESVDLVTEIGTQMAVAGSAMGHGTYTDIINQVAEYQRKHGGISDALGNAILATSAQDRFGFMHSTLTDLAVDEAVKNGDAAGVSALTNGTKALVTWNGDSTLSPKLVADDRSGEATTNTVVANLLFREGAAEITPNVAAALNSLYGAMGGGIHRTDNNITQANIASAERWKQESAQRINSGAEGSADTRTAGEVTGVYTSGENELVVADATYSEGIIGDTNTLTHELGHAFDSMLGEVVGSTGRRGFYSDGNAEFLAFRAELQDIASYGDSPDETLLNWYYRNKDEGATEHNGVSGTTESWAQTYAAYAAMRRLLAAPEEDRDGLSDADWQEKVFRRGGMSVLYGHGAAAYRAGLATLREQDDAKIKAGQAIYDFFDDFENNVLPKIMQNPTVVGKRQANPNRVGEALGAPAPPMDQRIPNAVQLEQLRTHRSKAHGEFEMTPIERGSPEFDQVMSEMKAANPGMRAVPENALAVTYNPNWKDQGNTLLWKAATPGADKATTGYSTEHEKTQHAQKFERNQGVDTVMDGIRAQALADAPNDPVAALVALVSHTGMRIGGGETTDPKTKKKQTTYGGTTLQKKHLTFPSDTLTRLRFLGKSGRTNTYETRDPVIRQALKQLTEGKKPSEQIFPNVTPDHTQSYIRNVSGMPNIINHDMRTFVANEIARQAIAKWPKSRMPKNQAQFRKAQIEVAKKVGAAINDNWDTALKSYINPAVWESFEDSAKIPHSFEEHHPYGLIEGGTVTTLVPGAPGGPPAPPGPGEPGTPSEPVAAAAASDETVVEPVDWSPEAVADRHAWYRSFQWPSPYPTEIPPPTQDELALNEEA